MAEVETMKLIVKEGLIEDSRKGVVRINREDMERLGLNMGACISIKGERVTSVKVFPAFGDVYGTPVIQMDGMIRRNAGVGLNETAEVSKNEVRKARKVVLSPLENFSEWRKEDEDELRDILRGIPLTCEDELSLILFGHQERGFRVNGTSPAGAVTVYTETAIHLVQPDLGNSKGRVTYEDVGGLNQQVRKIREILELPLKFPEVFRKLGIEAPKGILLYGPPGTGKTLIARAVASETKAHFLHVNGPEIMHKFYGESEAKLREVFQEARRQAPSIVFLDELDAIAPKRAEVHGEVEKRVVAQLLGLMDGLENRGQVVIIGATNIPGVLDPALRRPGRFDREVAILPPDREGRLEILKIHTKGMPLALDVDLAHLAQITYGFVGADLSALCKEAGMLALRKILDQVGQDGIIPSFEVVMADFSAALQEVEPSATREYYSEIPDVNWENIGGLSESKDILKSLLELPLHNPEACQEYMLSPPRGILLTGPSGSGKTLLAKAAAKSAKVNFIHVSAPTILSQWMGEAEKALHDLFVKAKQTAPCILFFDELDGIFRSRSASASLADRLINQMVLEFDGLGQVEGVTVLAATNRPELIDGVLMRGGRFEYILDLPLPQLEDREQILRIHSHQLPLAEDVSLERLAEETGGMSGAELATLCHKASFIALRQATKSGMRVKISQAIFAQAIAELKLQRALGEVSKG
ncbi:ATP-dependent zinc metalloprotease FtsH [Peptococcaceae bacterium CEB3]|nr:ATP-dependent zinc metalloprotease FtsH [Peptococcaceae bacterium CEB3]